MVITAYCIGLSIPSVAIAGGCGKFRTFSMINGQLQEIPGVVATETLISLEQSIKREIPVHFEEIE